MLLWLPPSMAIAEALRVVKTSSSRWVHQTRSRLRGFGWPDRLRRIQRQSVEHSFCGEIHSRAGDAPPPYYISGRTHQLPQEERRPVRRAVHLGMISSAPSGAGLDGGDGFVSQGSRHGLNSSAPLRGLRSRSPLCGGWFCRAALRAPFRAEEPSTSSSDVRATN